jgi:hypothetical protein
MPGVAEMSSKKHHSPLQEQEGRICGKGLWEDVKKIFIEVWSCHLDSSN